jgi:hypothetical protein
MTDLKQAHSAARAIALAALGCDPGPMANARSNSHFVYVSSDAVVKIIDAADHSRLDRETALVPHLPAGITAPLLDSGLYRLGMREVRYASVPGAAPGMGMPGVDGMTARLLAEQAVQRLDRLHGWMPTGHAEQTLREPLDHGGFVSRAALFAVVEDLTALNRDGIMPGHLLDGLTAVARRAATRTERRPRSRGLSLGQLARPRSKRDGSAGLRMGSLRRTRR